MKTMRWVAVLIFLTSCAVLSSAQTPPDGGVGVKVPAHKTQLITSTSFNLTAEPCPANPDCSVFGSSAVQEVFAGYNQSGHAFNSLSINLTFGGNDLNGSTYVGCASANILPAFTSANCLTPILIPADGKVTLTFAQGLGGIGVGCYNTNTVNDPVTTGNAACLSNSVTAINTDLATGGKAGLPYVYYYPPFASAVPPPIQATGPCTVPPNGGFQINTILPWLVCGDSSFVIGIGITNEAHVGDPGYGLFDSNALPKTADGIANTPEPQTLLLVGAAMFGMSLLLMKKKPVHA